MLSPSHICLTLSSKIQHLASMAILMPMLITTMGISITASWCLFFTMTVFFMKKRQIIARVKPCGSSSRSLAQEVQESALLKAAANFAPEAVLVGVNSRTGKNTKTK